MISLDTFAGEARGGTLYGIGVGPGDVRYLTLRAAGVQRDMDTPSYRDGSCASCHTPTIGPASPGPVYLLNDPKMTVPNANLCN